jgi:hypothetical protein
MTTQSLSTFFTLQLKIYLLMKLPSESGMWMKKFGWQAEHSNEHSNSKRKSSENQHNTKSSMEVATADNS